MGSIQVIVPKFVLQNDEKKHLRAMMSKMGREIVKASTALIRNAGGSGRYYPIGGSGHYASAIGEPPAALSGLLARSIKSKVFVTKHEVGVRITDSATNRGKPYGKFLEVGANSGRRKAGAPKRVHRKRRDNTLPLKMEPRPYISRVVAEYESKFAQQVMDAFVADIVFTSE